MHKKQWDFLKSAFESNQLSHSYLFTGQKEIGKKEFAVSFAEFIGSKFPDLMVVESEGAEISIKKIREVQKFLAYKSYHGGYKFVVVAQAEKMNQEAQSCFLKTLEEPKGKTLLVLITSKPDMLLPTIISRCQVLKFQKPKNLPENKEKVKKEKEILESLLPVMNSGFAEKFKYVKSIDFEEQDFSEILQVMQKYFRGLLLAQAGVAGTPNKKYSILKIKSIINLIEDINNKITFTNASPKLAMEILLMEI